LPANLVAAVGIGGMNTNSNDITGRDAVQVERLERFID
jgi:hypothetical protein